jgi:hypothetical protein
MLVSAAVLACVLAAEAMPTLPVTPELRPVATDTRRRARETMPPRDAATWSYDVVARPLFSTSRRPPAPKKSGASAPPAVARLAGIMLGENLPPLAIFAPAEGGKSIELTVGGVVNGETIARIESEKVVMSDGTSVAPSFDKDKDKFGIAPGTTSSPPPFGPFGQPPMSLSGMGVPAPAAPGMSGTMGNPSEQHPPMFGGSFFRMRPVPMPPQPPVPPQDAGQSQQQ